MTPTWLNDDEAGPWQIIHDTRFGYVVYARRRFHGDRPGGVEFGITTHITSAAEGDDVGRQYGDRIEATSGDPVTADAVVTGWIKWDGCSHLHWGALTDDGNRHDGYIHVCGGGSWDDLLAALAAVRKFAAEWLTDGEFAKKEDGE